MFNVVAGDRGPGFDEKGSQRRDVSVEFFPSSWSLHSW